MCFLKQLQNSFLSISPLCAMDSSSGSSSDSEPPVVVAPMKKKGRPSRAKALPSKLKDTVNDKEEVQCDLSSKYFKNKIYLMLTHSFV